MHTGILIAAVRFVLPVVLIAIHLPASATKVPQFEPNHLRWEKNDTVLGNAIAW